MSEHAEIAKITFAPMGALMDGAREREQWAALFVTLTTARKVCEMNEMEVETAMEKLILANPDDAVGTIEANGWAVEVLEDAINILKAGEARMIVGMFKASAT